MLDIPFSNKASTAGSVYWPESQVFEILTLFSCSYLPLCKVKQYSMLIPSKTELIVTRCMACRKSHEFEICYEGEKSNIAYLFNVGEKV